MYSKKNLSRLLSSQASKHDGKNIFLRGVETLLVPKKP